jgi:hypothetical protein
MSRNNIVLIYHRYKLLDLIQINKAAKRVRGLLAADLQTVSVKIRIKRIR